MKQNHIALFLVTIIGVLFITRELGLFDSRAPDYHITYEFSHGLNDNTVNLTSSKAGLHTDFGNQKFSQTKIFIRNAGENHDPNMDYALEIIIKKVKIPFSFIPFYTNIDYEFDALVNDNITSVKDDSGNVNVGKKTINGYITLKGNFKDYGLLSNKEIKRIITNDAKIILSQEVRKYLQSNEYASK